MSARRRKKARRETNLDSKTGKENLRFDNLHDRDPISNGILSMTRHYQTKKRHYENEGKDTHIGRIDSQNRAGDSVVALFVSELPVGITVLLKIII